MSLTKEIRATQLRLSADGVGVGTLMTEAQLIDLLEVIGGGNTVDGTFNNLTVNGTLSIASDSLTLNSSQTGTPGLNAALYVERGNSTNAVLMWDETDDVWKAGINGAEQALVLTNDARLHTQNTDTGTAGHYFEINQQMLTVTDSAELRFVTEFHTGKITAMPQAWDGPTAGLCFRIGDVSSGSLGMVENTHLTLAAGQLNSEAGFLSGIYFGQQDLTSYIQYASSDGILHVAGTNGVLLQGPVEVTGGGLTVANAIISGGSNSATTLSVGAPVTGTERIGIDVAAPSGGTTNLSGRFAGTVKFTGSGICIDASGATNTTGNSNHIRVGGSATIYEGTSGSNNALNFGGKTSYRFVSGAGRILSIMPSSAGVLMQATGLNISDTYNFTIDSAAELRLTTSGTNTNIKLTPNGTGMVMISNGSSSGVPLVVMQGSGLGSANLQEWWKNDSNPLAYISSDGVMWAEGFGCVGLAGMTTTIEFGADNGGVPSLFTLYFNGGILTNWTVAP